MTPDGQAHFPIKDNEVHVSARQCVSHPVTEDPDGEGAGEAIVSFLLHQAVSSGTWDNQTPSV